MKYVECGRIVEHEGTHVSGPRGPHGPGPSPPHSSSLLPTPPRLDKANDYFRTLQSNGEGGTLRVS